MNNLANLNIDQALDENLKAWGVSLWGAADLAPWQQQMAWDYGDAWQDYPRAVALAVFFPKAVIAQLTQGPTLTYQAYYDIVNDQLNQIALRTTLFLESLGYKAFPVPASQRVGVNKEAGIFSHRTAAHLAGLGWIGRNLSLINQDVGPRLRLATVLTDAPLVCGEPMANKCPPNCQECKKACPVEAILGKNFHADHPLESRFDFLACSDYLRQVRQSFGKEICGRCLAVCPFGK